MSRKRLDIAEAGRAILAAIAATGLSHAEFILRVGEYARQYGDDPDGARLFTAEMEKLVERRRRN